MCNKSWPGLLGNIFLLLILFDAHGTSGGRGGHSVTNDNANAACVSIISGITMTTTFHLIDYGSAWALNYLLAHVPKCYTNTKYSNLILNMQSDMAFKLETRELNEITGILFN